MMKVNSWIRCDAVDGGCYTVDRDGDPKKIIDMALSVVDAELWENLQLMRYAKVQTRRMFRELWKASDKHDKLIYSLEVCGRYAVGVMACLGGVVAVGWVVTAVERLVFG